MNAPLRVPPVPAPPDLLSVMKGRCGDCNTSGLCLSTGLDAGSKMRFDRLVGQHRRIAGGDTLVFVMDILSLVPSRATGVDQPAQAGFPAVTLADDGTPTITVPTTPAPADLQVEVLKKGDGATVAADSTVTVQYVGVTYATGAVFDQTWAGTGPTTVVLSQLVPGFGQALTGQTVGSQVLMVIPPDLAYGEAPDESNDLAGQTLVFVVDILAVGWRFENLRDRRQRTPRPARRSRRAGVRR